MATALTNPPPVPAPAATPRVPVVINDSVEIPSDVVDHESFRRWARSEAFPERGRFAFINSTTRTTR